MEILSPEIIIMGISLFISVSTPIITSIITSRHEIKMYRLRYFYEHKNDVIEGFIKYANAVLLCSNQENCSEFGKFAGEIYFYVPSHLHNQIDFIIKNINNVDYKNEVKN